MRRKPPEGRSLADRVPDVAAEWHPILNGGLTPHDVFAGSAERFWWRCATCGHEWETKLEKRVRQGQGCRKCSAVQRAKTRATPKPHQSLADVMPELAAEWHPTLNGDRTPSEVLPTSGARIWWLCARCQHEWQASVYRRSVGSGCRKCAFIRTGVLRSTPKPGQSFADYFPDPAAEWHPTRNGALTPKDVKPASNKRAWWLCAVGHEWSVSPSNRQRGEQCPECAELQRAITKSTPKAGRSLADLRPDIAAEWHPTKNAPTTAADVNPGSKTKRWWQCTTCGHEWRTDPDHRTRSGRGCPTCAYRGIGVSKATPKPGESLAEKNPELAAEWHPTLNLPVTPFDVRPRGRATAWWLCRFGHVWNARIAPRAVGIGCPRCSIVGVSERQVRLSFELQAAGLPVHQDYPPIPVEGRRSIRADIVMPTIRLVVEYDGSFYHARKAREDRKQTRDLESAGWTVLRVREEPLPSLEGSEVFVGPTEPIKSVTVKVLDALAAKGIHAIQQAEYVGDADEWGRSKANEALYKYRVRSLASEFPSVAEQFDPDKNDGIQPEEIHPGSQTKFLWTCPDCSNEWYSPVWVRTAGHGCPRCAHTRGAAKRALPEPGESLADLWAEVAAEWHPSLNGSLKASDVRAGSGKVVWWLCPRGHDWQARVLDRRRGLRCRECRAIERAKDRESPPN